MRKWKRTDNLKVKVEDELLGKKKGMAGRV
jgi:hypothetical protein